MQQLGERVLTLTERQDLADRLFEASADERRHAAMCAAIVRRLGGTPPTEAVGPPFPPTMSTDPLGVAMEHAVFLLCTGEAIAAALLRAIADAATEPGVAELLRQIAVDEARHGAVGWPILDALAARRSESTSMARPCGRQAMFAVMTYERARQSAHGPVARAWGIGSPVDIALIARRVVADEVAPKLVQRGLWPQ